MENVSIDHLENQDIQWYWVNFESPVVNNL
jgi:hypothetical protein